MPAITLRPQEIQQWGRDNPDLIKDMKDRKSHSEVNQDNTGPGHGST